jgi:hypothetical protein
MTMTTNVNANTTLAIFARVDSGGSRYAHDGMRLVKRTYPNPQEAMATLRRYAGRRPVLFAVDADGTIDHSHESYTWVDGVLETRPARRMSR